MLSILITIQVFLHSKGIPFISNFLSMILGVISRHYRSFAAIDVSQSMLGASKNLYFKIGIFYSNNTALIKINEDILYDLNNGIVRSNFPAALTLIQAQDDEAKIALPTTSISTLVQVPDESDSIQRAKWLKNQILSNNVDIWLVIDSHSDHLKQDLMVFLENSNQVVLLTDISISTSYKLKDLSSLEIYKIPDWIIIENREDHPKWVEAGFTNCLPRETGVIDQVIQCYRKKANLLLR